MKLPYLELRGERGEDYVAVWFLAWEVAGLREEWMICGERQLTGCDKLHL